MTKLPFRIIFISAALIILTVFIFFFLDKTSLSTLFSTKEKPKDQSSAFNSLNKDTIKTPNQTDTLTSLFDKDAGELKNKTDGFYIFALGSSLIDFDYFAPWNFEKTPFWAEIKSASVDTSSLDLKFVSPTTMPFVDVQKEVKVVGCAPYNSFLTIEDPRTTQTNMDFFATLADGDDMVGYCLNQECTQVGKLCKIYRD